jgi:hypothetical protein
MEINRSLERNFKNIPAFTVAMIILSYLNHYLYFYYFGIPIYNYLDATEIIFSFSSVIPALFIGIVLYMLMTFSDHYLREQREEEMKRFIERMEKRKLEEQQKPKKSESKKFSLVGWIFSKIPVKYHSIAKWFYILPVVAIQFMVIMAVMITTLFVLPALLFDNLVVIDNEWEYIFYFIFILIIAMINTLAPKGARITNVTYLAIIVIFITYKTRASYNAAIRGRPKYNIEIVLSNSETVKSDTAQLIHIGSTRNYHFLYNTKDKSSRIIPNSEVRDLVLRELRTGL